jgi:hypothetical protein
MKYKITSKSKTNMKVLPVASYVCETWSLTLREEHRLMVFKNRVLREIFGPKRDEVIRENYIMRHFMS